MTKTLRPIRIDGDVAYVPLTKGYDAVIDAEDVHLVEGCSWYSIENKRTVYAAAWGNEKYNRNVMPMHRVLLGLKPGGDFVDHIDGNGLNNRKSNLRLATISQNNHNQKLSSSSTSGLKGASFHKLRKRWRAQIKLNGNKIHIGYYDTAEQAHAAYCKASAQLHGEFGRTA
jgi:hypothetical protein